MSNYTQGVTRNKIYFCGINNQMSLRFKTKDYVALPGVSTSEFNANALGLLESAPSGKLIIVAANSPQPPKVSRAIRTTTDLDPTTQDRISTFCAYDRVAGLTRGGIWNIVSGAKNVSLRFDVNSASAIVTVQNSTGLEYYCVVPMNRVTFDAVKGDLNLGTPTSITTDTERAKLVFRSSNPKPGKASKYSVKNGKKVLSTHYCSDGADLLNDWQRISNSIAL